MQNMYSLFNPQYHREQMLNAYNQYMNAQYPQINTPQPGYSIFPVSNVDEANATKADLNYNPTFFFNQSKGEIYLKQLDRSTGAAIMRYFKEIAPTQDEITPIKQQESINTYSQQLNTILEGINGIYRILTQPQPTQAPEIVDVNIEEIKQAKGGKNAK